MGNNCRVKSSTASALQFLRAGQWRHFWVQRGVLDEKSRLRPGVHSVSSLTIEGTQLIRVGATSITPTPGCEVFSIDLEREAGIGTPQSERLWRPRRKQILEFPPDLDLSPFLGRDVEVSLLERCLTVGTGTAIDEYCYCDGLWIRANTDELIIVASEDLPESVVILRESHIIAAVFNNRTPIRIDKEVSWFTDA